MEEDRADHSSSPSREKPLKKSNDHRCPMGSTSSSQVLAFSFGESKISSSLASGSGLDRVKDANEPEVVRMMSTGCERLKKHREEVAGRVVIPDTWDQESLLEEWIDHSSFDRLLAPSGISSAREALAAEGRSRTSSYRMMRA